MVTTTPIIASVPTQDTLSNIAAISQAMSAALAEHGEANLLAGLAHAIGARRIVDAVATPAARFACEVVTDDGVVPQQQGGAGGKPPNSQKETLVTYYVAGCDGAKLLARRIGRTVFKVGYSCAESTKTRIGGLDRVAYGGWCGFASATSEPEQGWRDWSFARHEARDTDHLILPDGIEIDEGRWRVYLPAGVDPDEFDRIVKACMMPRQLDFWAMSGAGRTHCSQKNLAPDDLVRFSRNERTGLLRPTEELYVYAPRKDSGWFAAVLGEALARVRRLVTIN